MLEFRSEDLLGTVVWYRGGPMIGPVMAVHVDADSGRPVWASVPARLLVPLCRAELTADRRLLVALPPLAVEAAPPLPPGVEEVGRGLEDALYAHYAAALLAAATGRSGGLPTITPRHDQPCGSSPRPSVASSEDSMRSCPR